jgi:hypothetical protein
MEKPRLSGAFRWYSGGRAGRFYPPAYSRSGGVFCATQALKSPE